MRDMMSGYERKVESGLDMCEKGGIHVKPTSLGIKGKESAIIVMQCNDDEECGKKVSTLKGSSSKSTHVMNLMQMKEQESALLHGKQPSQRERGVEVRGRKVVKKGERGRGREREREWRESSAQKALKRIRWLSEMGNNVDAANEGWEQVEKRFDDLASPSDGLLPRPQFAKCIGIQGSEKYVGDLLDALGRKKGHAYVQRISKDNLKEYYQDLIDQRFDSRLQLFFELMFDTTIDCRITEVEVKEIIMLSASSNQLSKLKERAEEYASLIMERLDPDNIGYIEAWQLESLLLHGSPNQGYPNNNQSFNNVQNMVPALRRNPIWRLLHKVNSMVLGNWRRILILTLWTITMASLFSYKFYQYRQSVEFQVMGYCICVAKGVAETLKFNMALILFPVCRNTITWLRNTKLRLIVPFDDNLNFHKIIALFVLLGTMIHGGVHVTCDFPRIINAPEDKFALISYAFGHKRPSYGFLLGGIDGVTGIIMVVLMIVAFTLATRWFRRNIVKLPSPFHNITGFNAFWYTHHTFSILYICLIIHGIFPILKRKWYHNTTWMYLALPILVYLCERFLRAIRSGYYGVGILKVAIYPGDVLSLHMSKPPGFNYLSGQYMFLKCPDISPFEWHPFSITSAPDDDYLSVHIRTAGDWTHELRCLFSKCFPSMGGEMGVLKADVEQGCKRFPTILIDGPYGAPAQHHMKYTTMILIGLGIGATPFISILKDILNNMKYQNDSCKPNKCFVNTYGGNAKKEALSTSRAYFYWVTREEGSFEWFKGVMNEIAEFDHKGVIELHNHLTGVYDDGDAITSFMTMLQALHHGKHGVDILSGTRVRTHMGKPDWRKVFSRVATEHKGSRVGVFYCGAPMLGREIKKIVLEFNQEYSIDNTRFDFYKENF